MIEQSVLVLEDDNNFRDLVVETLEDEGISAVGVGSAAEAVVLALESSLPFDIVLSDIRMAGPMDGMGALEQIKLRLPHLSCLVMTGYASDSVPARALSIEVEDYLYKPFRLNTICDCIRRVRKKKESLFSRLSEKMRERQFESLHLARTRCYQFFFVSVRSRLLTPDRTDDALIIWDALENAEARYRQGFSDPGSLKSLMQVYERFLETAKTFWSQPIQRRGKEPRGELVGRKEMRNFLENIGHDYLSLEDVHIASNELFEWRKANRQELIGEAARIWGWRPPPNP